MDISYEELIKKPYINLIKNYSNWSFLSHPSKKYNSNLGTGVVYVFKKVKDNYIYAATIESNEPNDIQFGNKILIQGNELLVSSKKTDYIYDLQDIDKFIVLSALTKFDIHPYKAKMSRVLGIYDIISYSWSSDKSKLLIYFYELQKDKTKKDCLELFDFQNNVKTYIYGSIQTTETLTFNKFECADNIICVEINYIISGQATLIFIKNEFAEWEIQEFIDGFVSMLDDTTVLFKNGILEDFSEFIRKEVEDGED